MNLKSKGGTEVESWETADNETADLETCARSSCKRRGRNTSLSMLRSAMMEDKQFRTMSKTWSIIVWSQHMPSPWWLQGLRVRNHPFPQDCECCAIRVRQVSNVSPICFWESNYFIHKTVMTTLGIVRAVWSTPHLECPTMYKPCCKLRWNKDNAWWPQCVDVNTTQSCVNVTLFTDMKIHTFQILFAHMWRSLMFGSGWCSYWVSLLEEEDRTAFTGFFLFFEFGLQVFHAWRVWDMIPSLIWTLLFYWYAPTICRLLRWDQRTVWHHYFQNEWRMSDI